MSRTSDLYPQLHLIAPNTYSNYFSFTKRYSDGHTDEEKGFWDATGSSNLNELKHRLFNTFTYRRTKQDVLPELPPKIYQEVFFDTPKGYYAIQTPGMQGLTKRIMYIADAKIKPTITFLKDMMLNINPILFYTMHTEYLHKVCEKLEAPYIDGSVTGVKRDRILNNFKQGWEPLLGANILSLGVGVSLDNCHTVVCGEVAWTPAQLDQGIDRCHRMTTTKPVNIYYLLMPNSVDYHIKHVVADKREIIRSVTHLQRILKTTTTDSGTLPGTNI
jgi:SNF2 family DNA or RNA helicase